LVRAISIGLGQKVENYILSNKHNWLIKKYFFFIIKNRDRWEMLI